MRRAADPAPRITNAPGGALLKGAYRRAVFMKTMQEKAAELEAELEKDLEGQKIATPKQLERKVAALLKRDSSLSWDDAIWRIAEPLDDEEDGS